MQASRQIGAGAIATPVLLLVFAGIVSAVSGVQGLRQQWAQYWPYILALAIGFGIQVGLYAHLRHLVSAASSKGVVAVSGITSTGAMISCCAHYLANVIPFIGAAGVATLIGQYQIELFWVGLASNALGIAYSARNIILFNRNTYET